MVASEDLPSGPRVLRTLRRSMPPAIGVGVGGLGGYPENMSMLSLIDERLTGISGNDSERVFLVFWLGGLLTMRRGLG